MIKLALFYFLEHVLFGKEGKNLIDMEWVVLVDNLEAFNKYPLGRRGDLLWDDTIWFAKSFGEPGIQTLIVSTLMLPSFSGSGE